MNFKRFWPWKTIARLSAELVEKDSQIARLQKEVGLFRNLNQTKLQEVQDAVNMKSENIEQLSLEVKRLEKQVEEKDQAMRKLGVILAMSKGIAVLFMLCCVTADAQPVVRSPLTTNLMSLAPADGWFVGSSNGVPVWLINGGMLTNIQGSSIVGAITGMVFIASDTAAHIDAITPGLGELLWAYDGNRFTVGDGATAGGVDPVPRQWLTPTNALFAGSRLGEMALTTGGFVNLATAPIAISPTIWIDAASQTNWLPIFSFVRGNTNYQSGQLNSDAFFKIDPGTNGANYVPALDGLLFGIPGYYQRPFDFVVGGGGNAFDISGNNVGGLGGNIVDVFKVVSGHGGNATANNGLGGNGGSVNVMFSIVSGNGGNDAFGNQGGNGGNVAGISFKAGNGGDATAIAQGANGGNTGTLTADGGNASGATAGGNGGSISFAGNGGFSSGNLTVSASSSRNGGSLNTFGSSYAPMTIFTTTTSTGPNASAAETSLLGTAANLAPIAGQPQGKNLASNVVDHVGRTLRFTVTGEITNNTPSLQLKIKLGSTVILSTDSVALVTTANVTNKFRFTGQLTFRTTGSSGTVRGEGFFDEYSSTVAVKSFSTTNQTTVTIDTTTDQAVDCTATFNAATGQMVGNTSHFELVD